MSKRNNNFRRIEQAYEANKKDKNHFKTNSFHGKQSKNDSQNGSSKQVESRIEYINFKQQEEQNINRLDLIFQKEPKQIQEKLMKLLISYNAILHYNKNTDLFEVDLLLPFLNEEEKREFVRQFLEIRKNKPVAKLQDKSNEWIVAEDLKQNKKKATSSNNNTSKEIRKFSFNNNSKFLNEFEQQIEQKQEEMIDQLNYQEEQIDEQKKKIVFLSEQYNKFKGEHQSSIKSPFNTIQNQPFDLRKIQQSISQRLKNAISIINRRKGKDEVNKQNQTNSRSIFISQQQQKAGESIIQRYAENYQFNDSQKFSQKNSNYIKEDIGETQDPSEEQLFGKVNFNQYNFANNYQSQANKYRQVIEQQQQEEDFEPLFNKNPQKPKNDKITSFEDYTKKYTTLKQDKNKKRNEYRGIEKSKAENQVNVPKNYFSSKQKTQHKKSEKSFDVAKAEKKNEEKGSYKTPSKNGNQRAGSRHSSSHSHSRSYSTHRESPSKQSQQIRQHINDFFSQHKQNLQNLYSQIRSKIKSHSQTKSSVTKPKQVERQPAPQKSSEDLYILVLDDLEQQPLNTSSAQIPNSKEFKSEIIKQYKKEILVNSKNLSSEDLIRYFRFLHAHAKKLYLKYLTNKQK